MLRQILLHALPLLLPFIVYIGYVVLARRAPKGKVWADAPWFWLAVAGLVLVIASFIALALFPGNEPGAYVPPQVEDGVVVPGHLE